MSELLPCPFCGKIPVLGKWGKMHVVIHRDCTFIDSFSDVPNGDGFGASGRTEEEAIEHWNTRHERTCKLIKHVARDKESGIELVLYECGQCGWIVDPNRNERYCPNCGARVKEEE